MRKILPFLCLLLAVCLFSGCAGGSSRDVRAVLDDLCAGEAPLPAGEIRHWKAPAEDEKPLTDDLLAAMFGSGTLPPEAEEIDDLACFLAPRSPVEITVIRCKASGDTDRIARMCLSRLSHLQSSYAGDPDAAEVLDGAFVAQSGRYVVLCVVRDTAEVKRQFRRAV